MQRIGGNLIHTGHIVQVVEQFAPAWIGATPTAMNTTSGPPTNTQGVEVTTLTLTPKFATSNLLVEASVVIGINTTARFLIGALFRDSDVDAFVAGIHGTNGAIKDDHTINMSKIIPANSVNPTTFKLRGGQNSSSITIYINGHITSGTLWSGVAGATFIRVWEIAA